MITFSQEIYKLLQTVQADLKASQTSGRTAKNELSEAHYLAAWVTMAIRNKRFDSILLPTLKKWQNQARSLGKNAGLKNQFVQLERCYKIAMEDDESAKQVNKEQLLQFCSQLEALDWMTTTDLIVGTRLNRHSDGKHSVIVCAGSMDEHFDENGSLIKETAIYIRGDQQVAINTAFNHGLLLYKKTDYKSKVKYHGEFMIYPENSGKTLPELPAL